MRIGVDLDGVLAETSEELARRIKKEFNIDTSALDFARYDDFFTDNNLDIKWLYKQFDDEWFWSKARPIEVNVDAVKDWASRGHEIHIITGRSEKASAIVTKAWLRKNKIPTENLTFEPIMHKVDYIKAQDIPVMFEDMFFEANKIASFGIQSFVIRRHWNSSFESRVTNPLVTFIDDLYDAEYFLKERESIG